MVLSTSTSVERRARHKLRDDILTQFGGVTVRGVSDHPLSWTMGQGRWWTGLRLTFLDKIRKVFKGKKSSSSEEQTSENKSTGSKDRVYSMLPPSKKTLFLCQEIVMVEYWDWWHCCQCSGGNGADMLVPTLWRSVSHSGVGHTLVVVVTVVENVFELKLWDREVVSLLPYQPLARPYSGLDSFPQVDDDYHHDSPIDILVGPDLYWTLISPVDAFHVVAMKSVCGYILMNPPLCTLHHNCCVSSALSKSCGG